MRKKFTYQQHKEKMLDIINRPKQTVDRRGTLKKLIDTARSNRART